MNRESSSPTRAGALAALLLLSWAPPLAAQTEPPPPPATAQPPASEPAAPAIIEGPEEIADRLHVQAEAEAKNGNFQKAYELLDEAFRLKKSYDIAANLGQAALKVKEYRSAAEALSWSIAHLPTGKVSLREALEELLQKARAEIATVRLRANMDKAQFLVDGAPVGASPLDREIYLDPGPHVFEATRPGYSGAREERTLERGKESVIELTLTDRDDPGGSGSARKAGFIVAGVFGGLAIGAFAAGGGLRAAAGSRASDAETKLQQLPDRRCEGANLALCQEIDGDWEAVDSMRNASNVTFAVGGVLAAAAIGGLVYGLTRPTGADTTTSRANSDALSSSSDSSSSLASSLAALSLAPILPLDSARQSGLLVTLPW